MLKHAYKAFLIHAALAGSNPYRDNLYSFAMPVGTARLGSLSYPARLLVVIVSVVRVHPRASKGITDLLLSCLARLGAGDQGRGCHRGGLELDVPALPNSPSGSRSLPQSRRQITSRTKNGHAPLSTVSGKLCKPTIHSVCCSGKVPRVESN